MYKNVQSLSTLENVLRYNLLSKDEYFHLEPIEKCIDSHKSYTWCKVYRHSWCIHFVHSKGHELHFEFVVSFLALRNI